MTTYNPALHEIRRADVAPVEDMFDEVRKSDVEMLSAYPPIKKFAITLPGAWINFETLGNE